MFGRDRLPSFDFTDPHNRGTPSSDFNNFRPYPYERVGKLEERIAKLERIVCKHRDFHYIYEVGKKVIYQTKICSDCGRALFEDEKPISELFHEDN